MKDWTHAQVMFIGAKPAFNLPQFPTLIDAFDCSQVVATHRPNAFGLWLYRYQ